MNNMRDTDEVIDTWLEKHGLPISHEKAFELKQDVLDACTGFYSGWEQIRGASDWLQAWRNEIPKAAAIQLENILQPLRVSMWVKP